MGEWHAVEQRAGIVRWRDLITRPVIVGAYAFCALRTGELISYATVNADLANVDPHLDRAC